MHIALAGRIGCGKDTIAKHLADVYGYTPVSFARELKEFTRKIFPMFTDETLYGPSAARNAYVTNSNTRRFWNDARDRARNAALYPEIQRLFNARAPDAFLALMTELTDMQKMPGSFTARRALQRLGTDWGRKICDTVWIDALAQTLRGTEKRVITDCRFRNEAEAMHRAGCRVVWVDASMRVRPDKAASAHSSEPGYEDFEGLLSCFFDNNGPESEIPQRVRGMFSTFEKVPQPPYAST